MLLETLRAIYALAALMLAAYTLGQGVLILLYWRHRQDTAPLPSVADWPTVTVQLPIYNEQHVVRRLLRAVAALDYPRDRLRIQVLDDSTDETQAIIAEEAARMQAQGLCVSHLRRTVRSGYKAGALAYGLSLDDAPLLALFDADFVPPPDFLRRTVPYFSADPCLGIVQTRWDHLNAADNWLTRAQALSIDAHFVVEQTARQRAGLLLTFNGTGGLWRRACIDAAGGWSDDTLTEDLDLSYRAQMLGWRYLFLPELAVPGEVPPQLSAYKRQQARWAQGSDQSFGKLFGRLWAADLSWGQRLMAVQHLGQYLPHPMMLILLLLTPPLLWADGLAGLPLAPLGLVGLLPPLMHGIAQTWLHPPRMALGRLVAFPALMLLGPGLAWNNSRALMAALWGGLTGQRGEFKRTPKFGASVEGSRYRLRADWAAWVELLLALYAAVGAWLALRHDPALLPFLAFYALSLAVVGGGTLLEGRRG